MQTSYKSLSIREKESIKGFEQSLIKQDQNYVNQLEVVEAQLAYYNEKFLPSIFNDYSLLIPRSDSIRPKIAYLKAEYRNYLENRKKGMYVDHVRNSRSFQPNALKLALMNYQLACMFPAYNLFKGHMDEPTKAVKDFLVEKLWYYSSSIDEKLKAILKELQNFTAEIMTNKPCEIRGWHTTVHLSEKQEQEAQLMCLVLLDRDKYGY